jgi:hypothetical protein
MLDEMFVSVVIPAWRDEEPLTRTLQHVRTAPEVEVIVVCVLGDELLEHSASRLTAAHGRQG